MESIIIIIIKNDLKKLTFSTKDNNIIILLNINTSNYKLKKNINKISNLINVVNPTKIKLQFNEYKNTNENFKVISLIHNILYNYNNKIRIEIDNDNCINLYNQLNGYKDIVMHPNKTQITFLEHVLQNVPDNYKTNIFVANNNITSINNIINQKNKNVTIKQKLFPLCNAVNNGSINPWFFVHIKPITINSNALNLYLIGKSVIFDSGGMNIKHIMNDMKCDMIGGGILISLLKLLKNDLTNINIHIILPIVENMISNTAVRPGNVITTNNNKTVEIVDTDAEGRLCIADALEYVNDQINIKQNNLIIDIATLTGNALQITESCSAIGMSNTLGSVYLDKMINTGDITGEYVDKLKLYEEYNQYHKSNVAHIANHNYNTRSECVIAGSFLNFFTSSSIPWIHLDIAAPTFQHNMVNSWGVNLLYTYIKSL